MGQTLPINSKNFSCAINIKGRLSHSKLVPNFSAISLEFISSEFTIQYSSVRNRSVGQNKRAGGKILKKTFNVQTQIRPCRGDFFFKINKRAGEIPIQMQENKRAGGFFFL